MRLQAREIGEPDSPWNAGSPHLGFGSPGSAASDHPPLNRRDWWRSCGVELETAAAVGGPARCTVCHFPELAGLGREAHAFRLHDDNL
jgi:hypothetical protein